MIMAMLFGISLNAHAEKISSPSPGIVCDPKAGFCVDNQGIAMGLTEVYLGKSVEENLQKSLGDGAGVSLDQYTLSNGVYCDSKEQQCYKDRYYPRTPDKFEHNFTHQIFNK